MGTTAPCGDRNPHHPHPWPTVGGGVSDVLCPGVPWVPTTDSSAGASRGEASTPAEGPSVPIIDVTAVVADLYEQADAARVRRTAALTAAGQEAALADYLEQLAALLTGGSRV